ncbi:MAG TPA: histidine kinase N-terminal 7TM domain-containing protein, partial [Anaerolineaceae bacterium]|nr:histidine kinase N-terminal 7TM domain-containing protein [Anaerolineaceae bacterium]
MLFANASCHLLSLANMQPNSISGFVFLCGILLIAIALFAWRRRTTNGAGEFALFMLLAAIYVLGYSLELASLDLATMLFWSKLQYIGVYFFPPLFLVFILRYTGQDRWITRRNLILLLALPALLMAAKLADGQLHWIYRTAAVDRSGPIPLLAITRGPLYVVSAVYNLILVGTGMLLLWNKRRFSSSLYRRQATLMTLSGLGPLLVYLVYILQFQPVSAWRNIDLNCFIFLVWGAGISWTMFRYRLFDLAPIAREALIEKLNDGLVVVDLQHRIVDTNPAAMRLFGWSRPPIGQAVEPRMARWIDQTHGDAHCPPAPIEAPFRQPG